MDLVVVDGKMVELIPTDPACTSPGSFLDLFRSYYVFHSFIVLIIFTLSLIFNLLSMLISASYSPA